jgi:hypothetical protein
MHVLTVYRSVYNIKYTGMSDINKQSFVSTNCFFPVSIDNIPVWICDVYAVFITECEFFMKILKIIFLYTAGICMSNLK